MFQLVFSYIKWHYSRAYLEIMAHTRNAVSFFYHFFAIGALWKNLFSPWRMLGERYKKGINIEAFFETLVVNTLMRFVGFLVRIVFIVIGLISILISFIIGAAVFVGWTFLPLFILDLFLVGLRFLAK